MALLGLCIGVCVLRSGTDLAGPLSPTGWVFEALSGTDFILMSSRPGGAAPIVALLPGLVVRIGA